MNNENKKDDTLGPFESGIFFGTILLLIVVLIIFLWSPVSYYLGKWNNYWNSNIASSEISFEDRIYDSNRWKAVHNCNDKASKLWGENSFYSVSASSTSEDFSTYDCYGIKYTLIK